MYDACVYARVYIMCTVMCVHVRICVHVNDWYMHAYVQLQNVWDYMPVAFVCFIERHEEQESALASLSNLVCRNDWRAKSLHSKVVDEAMVP